MRVDLPYGRGHIPLTLAESESVAVIRKPHMPILEDPGSAVLSALACPVRSPPLSDVARGKSSACIAICDITRPVPNGLFLRPLIEQLLQAGMAAANISVLVATGLHRPNEGAELAELIGDSWVLDHVTVLNHFARDDDQHVTLGRTSRRGTVIRLDRRFVEADVRIVTGLVEPHFMAGYSGGRKVIAPGLAHAETITTFHNARFMADPAARNCNFEENPLHEEQLEIVRRLGDVWAVNTVIDEQRRLSFVNFGEIISSHQQAVDFVRSYCEVPLPRRYRTIVTTAAGDPLDKTYYQTIKGMVAALEILEPGGDLLIASACTEGMGSAEFVDAQRRLVALGPDAFLASIHAKTHASIDEWQTQMLTKALAAGRVHLYSTGLDELQHSLTGVEKIGSLDDAVRISLARSGDNAIAVIPEGPYVAPFVA